MGQLFGIISNEPQRLYRAIASACDVLVARGDHVGWGLGCVHSGEVLLKRHPRPVADINVYDALAAVTSDYIIVYASKDDTYTGNDNTQPFRYKKWMYAQSGTIANFDRVRPALLEHIPAFMQRNIQGTSPAEHVFHIFLAVLHRISEMSDRNLPLTVCRQALREALAITDRAVTNAGTSWAAGNLIVSNSRSMVAVRTAEPLYLRRFRHVDKKREEGQEFRAVVVATSDDSDGGTGLGEGFEAIPTGSAILITRDLQIDVVQLAA